MFKILNIIPIILVLGVNLIQFSLATEINPIRQYNLEQYSDSLVAENKIQIKKRNIEHLDKVDFLEIIYKVSKEENVPFEELKKEMIKNQYDIIN